MNAIKQELNILLKVDKIYDDFIVFYTSKYEVGLSLKELSFYRSKNKGFSILLHKLIFHDKG